MKHRHFIIVLPHCTGCGACSIACKDRLNLPDDVDCLQIEQSEEGQYPRPQVRFRPMHCFHCGNPPCVPVCPTQALTRGENGFVALDAEKCIVCGKCVKACPFQAISLLPKQTAIKCDGCADEVADGRMPVCVRACPMRALGYAAPGDFDATSLKPAPAFNDHGIEPKVLFLTR